MAPRALARKLSPTRSRAFGDFLQCRFGFVVKVKLLLVGVEGGGVGVAAGAGPAEAVGLVQELVIHDEIDQEGGDGWGVERAAEHDCVVDPVVVAELSVGEGAGPEELGAGDAIGEVAGGNAGVGGGEVVVVAARFVNESRSPKARRLDLGGVAILTLALSLLLYPLIQGREAGWPMWTFVSLGAALPVLLLFVQYEKRVTASGGSPLVELSLFHDRAFVIGLFSGVCFFSGAAAFFLISTIFLQNGLAYTAREAGLTFTSFAIAFLGSSLSSVRVQPKLGSRIINLGAALMMTGLTLLLWLTAVRGASLTGLELAPVLLIYGTGQGFVMPTLINTILINIKGHDAGSAAGVLTTVQQVSFATGVAVIGTVFFSSLGALTTTDAFVRALRIAFSVNICLLAVTFVLILQIPRNAHRSPAR